MKLTITEALAELKTISARVGKKKEAILRNIARDSRVRDALEKEGGSAPYIQKELQAIFDLDKRYVRIRGAIQRANALNSLTLYPTEDAGASRAITLSVMDWLNWRRGVMEGEEKLWQDISGALRQANMESRKRGGVTVAARDADHSPTPESQVVLILNIDEADVNRKIEEMEKLKGDLDGKLSLHNATAVIEID